jgi:hypothetical protein
MAKQNRLQGPAVYSSGGAPAVRANAVLQRELPGTMLPVAAE